MSDVARLLLPTIEELDTILSRLVPVGDVQLRGIENDVLQACAPGALRALENLWLARRTLSSVYVLAKSGADTGADHTEDIAVLGRRLLELTAQMIWLADYEPTAGLALPAGPGAPSSLLADGDPGSWPSQTHRYGFAAALCAATEWVDVQALRSQLAELRNQKRTGVEIAQSYEDEEARTRSRRRLGMLVDQQRMIGLRLTELGAPITPCEDTVSILTKKAGHLTVLWRTESDVTHGGAVGRQMQRGGDGQPQLGAPAQPWRQVLVLILAINSIIDIAVLALAIVEVDDAELRAFVPRAYAAFGEAQTSAPPAGSGDDDSG